jgi:hypothetical protein
MSSVPSLFNAVNKAVLSECTYRVDKIEGLYLEIFALFEAIQLLDPIEERVKQIENQTRNIRYNFEHSNIKAIAECNRDTFNIKEEMKEIKRKMDDDEKIKKLEKELNESMNSMNTSLTEKITKLENEKIKTIEEKIVAHERDVNEKVNSLNTILNEKVNIAEIGDSDEKIKRLEHRVITLESKPCSIPEVLINSLEYSMDQKIKNNNEVLDDIITNTITTAIQGILQD